MKEEKWLEAIVYFRSPFRWENKRKVALEFVKPTLEELWKRKAIRFFHYFFEPELHLRLYSERDNFEEIKAVITERIKPLQDDLLCPVEFNGYHGEFESFFDHTGNEEAWYIGRDFFMENSGTALHFLEMLDKETLFNPTNWMLDRFLHSFFNELGFSNLEEGKILFEYSIFRATVETRNSKDRERTRKILDDLKQKLQSLTTEFLKQL